MRRSVKDRVCEIVQRLSEGSGFFEDEQGVILRIAKELGVVRSSVTVYLGRLRREGVLEIVYGKNPGKKGRVLTGVRLLNGNAASLDQERPSRSLPLAMVLVDGDNAVLAANRAGYQLSFFRLRQYIRRLGRPIFAEVFLPRRSRHMVLADRILEAGFELFVCPKEFKDKDSVDSRIKSRVKRFAEHSRAKRIVIVSEDADFSRDPDLIHFVRDLSKELLVVGTSGLRAELEGEDRMQALPISPRAQTFQRVFSLIGRQLNALNTDDIRNKEFVTDVARETVNVLRASRIGIPFNSMLDEVWVPLAKKWSAEFNVRDAQAALTALRTERFLLRHMGRSATLYRLNEEHPAVQIILPAEAPKEPFNPAMRILTEMK